MQNGGVLPWSRYGASEKRGLSDEKGKRKMPLVLPQITLGAVLHMDTKP